jgi:hypothetical protein
VAAAGIHPQLVALEAAAEAVRTGTGTAIGTGNAAAQGAVLVVSARAEAEAVKAVVSPSSVPRAAVEAEAAAARVDSSGLRAAVKVAVALDGTVRRPLGGRRRNPRSWRR